MHLYYLYYLYITYITYIIYIIYIIYIVTYIIIWVTSSASWISRVVIDEYKENQDGRIVSSDILTTLT